MKTTLVALCLALAGCQQAAPASQGAKAKPQLALLTSLPIMFEETLTLGSSANPLLTSLEEVFEVEAVDGPEALPPGGLLLAVQPQALTAERLVALDGWVRDGGRMVLLADPWLSWESRRPLGDTLRPPFTFPDTGLLIHWGLSLVRSRDAHEERKVKLAGWLVTMEGVGAFEGPARGCRPIAEDVAVSCQVGKGRVTVVADADWVTAGMRGSGLVDYPENRAALIKLLQRTGR